jgi:hypothetical protein
MSATIGDDSAIIRTFDADPDSVSKPIVSESLAGVSERMILVPELTGLHPDQAKAAVEEIAAHVSVKRKEGVVILVPSDYAARQWERVGRYASETQEVSRYISELQNRSSTGPFVFANRYDGIDLPGPSCRLLILAGVPRGMSEYDFYRANAFLGGTELDSTLAQRLEQGMGRGARGAGDYCVVILAGRDLIAWLSRARNQALLTSSTRAQFEIGREVSKDVSDRGDFSRTVIRCLTRDRDWLEYHAERLAELAGPTKLNAPQIQDAALERKCFKLVREGYLEKAIDKLGAYCAQEKDLDPKTKGWLLQFAARIADLWGQADLAQQRQQDAYAFNKNLLRPRIVPPYSAARLPGGQAQQVVKGIAEFGYRRGYLAHFEEVVSHLTSQASSNQFEEALASFGRILGFHAERPDDEYRVGPDVLWLVDEDTGLIIEAKSRKNASNALTKEQHGQLLNAAEWFHKVYPSRTGVRVSIHPNVVAGASVVTGKSKALTLDRLNALVSAARSLLQVLCNSGVSNSELIVRAEQELVKLDLTPTLLVRSYLIPFESVA